MIEPTEQIEPIEGVATGISGTAGRIVKVSLKRTTHRSDTSAKPEFLILDLRMEAITMKSKTTARLGWIAIATLAGLALNTGCQVHVAGQTLPSPYYLMDDIQYFPAGSENKLANETAALKADREAARARRAVR